MPKFMIVGANRDTGEDRSFIVEAQDESDARQQASEFGVVVASVERIVDQEIQRATQQLPVQVVERSPSVNVAYEHRHRGQVEQVHKRSNSLGITAMILGIIALPFSFIPFLSLLSLPISVLALLLACIGLVVSLSRTGYGIGYPIGGLTLSGFAIIIATVTGIVPTMGAAEVARESAREQRERNTMAATDASETETALNPPAPEPPPDKSPDPEAIDWQRTAAIGDIRISITSIAVSKPRVTWSYSDDVIQGENETLIIRLRIENASTASKLEYRTWRGGLWSLGRDIASINDDHGNTYKRIDFGISTFPAEAVESSESVYPGADISDTLVFEPPVASARNLYMELPGENIGEEGLIRFRVDVDSALSG